MKLHPGLVVAALSLVGAVTAGLLMPSAPASTGEQAPVAATVARGCPPVTTTARLGAVALGATVESAPLARDGGDQPVEASVTIVGNEALRVVTPAAAPTSVVLGTSAVEGTDRGLSMTSCPIPRTDEWFVGVRSSADWQANVELVNLDATAAEVGVVLYATSGRVAVAGTRGIMVPPRSTRTLSLTPLVRSDEPITMRVETTQGRVGVTVRQRVFSGPFPNGTDWVESAAAPAELQIIAGVPRGPGERQLVVTNPGHRMVRAEIDILGATGPFRATGAESVDVPPESTRVVDLAPGLIGSGGGIKVSASGPVTAAMYSTSTVTAATSDWAVQPAGVALGPHAIAVVPLPPASVSGLTLANGADADATAIVLARGVNGAELMRQAVQVPAAAAVRVELPAVEDPTWEVTTTAPHLVASLDATTMVGEVQGLASLGMVDTTGVAHRRHLEADPRVGA